MVKKFNLLLILLFIIYSIMDGDKRRGGDDRRGIKRRFVGDDESFIIDKIRNSLWLGADRINDISLVFIE